MNDFERLLSSHTGHIKDNIGAAPDIALQKADKSASLVDFIEMLDKIITAKMETKKVVFMPDEGKKLAIDPSKEIDNPYIAYKVVSRTPKGELKPRIRETITEELHESSEARIGHVYGQRFETILQFNIFSPSWREAEDVLNDFEELMLTYAYHFKRNGVGEILFHKQYTDENLDIYREKMSIRSIQYYIELEKLTAVFYDEFESIEIK